MSTPSAIHRIAAATGFLLAAALLFWVMAILSAWITRERLTHDARVTLETLRAGQPLWRWILRSPGDLVAGRVFGHAEVSHDADGLRFTSRDGSPFELGLPLKGPVDLSHWPLLRLHLAGSAEGVLGLSYQAGEFSETCAVFDAWRITPGETAPVIDLHALRWQSTSGKSCPAPDVVSYMLRLRPQMPAHATLRIEQASLLPAAALLLPTTIDARSADIQLKAGLLEVNALTLGSAPKSAPLIRLPADVPSETMLALRDRITQRWPAALIMPFGQSLSPSSASPKPSWLDRAVCGIYLAWLAWLVLRHTREVIHPWIEIAAIAAGPLWLIAGLRWGPEISGPGVVAFLAALAYAGQAEWRRRPVCWSWWGTSWADWLWPMVPLLVTAALVMIDGHGLIRLAPGHILAYLAWALLQQWAMLAIVMGRLKHTGLPEPAIILITAGLFGLLHTPNGSLMQLCVAAELWWAWRFLRSPRLIPIALAHATCALLAESGLTGHLLRSLEVSARFFSFQ